MQHIVQIKICQFYLHQTYVYGIIVHEYPFTQTYFQLEWMLIYISSRQYNRDLQYIYVMSTQYKWDLQ